MKNKTPSIEEWRLLYEAAAEFKKTKCWEWMYDDDIFGVKDPETGEVGYCCIMGYLGEHFAIAAYLGSEGLDGLLQVLSGKLAPNDPDNMFMQKCLMASFEDRKSLAPQGLKIIRDLDLSLRGKNAWPVFRNYTPGLHPWFITAQECRFLIHVLRQAVHVALRCKTGKKFLEHRTPFTFLVRVPEKTEGVLSWVDEYLTAEPLQDQMVSFGITDEVKLRRLLSNKPKTTGEWEADTFYAPVPVKEKGRPYYPKVCLILDHRNSLILSFEMVEDIWTEGHRFVDTLVSMIERSGQIPARLLVARDEAYCLFSEVCMQLGIGLERVPRLEHMEQARSGMIDFFKG